jgi:hypothetical protein
MSTGADCYFVQNAEGEWTYHLQRWPYGETPDYDKFGPFRTHEAAEQHLSENHGNPGGWADIHHPNFTGECRYCNGPVRKDGGCSCMPVQEDQ